MDESFNNTVVIDLAQQITDDSFSSLKCNQNNISKLELSLKNLLCTINSFGKIKLTIDLFSFDNASVIFNRVFNTAKKITGKSWDITVGLLDKFSLPFQNLFNMLNNSPTNINIPSLNNDSSFDPNNNFREISSDNENLPRFSNNTKNAELNSMSSLPKYTDTAPNHSHPDHKKNIVMNPALSPENSELSHSKPDNSLSEKLDLIVPYIFTPYPSINLKEILAPLYASPSFHLMSLRNPSSEVVLEKNPPLPNPQSLFQSSIEKQYSNTKINSFIKEPQKFSVEFTTESQKAPFQSSLETQAPPFNSMLNSNNTITNSSSNIQSSPSENVSKSENAIFNASSDTNLSTNNLSLAFSKPLPESDDLSKASSNFKSSPDKFSGSFSDLQNKFLYIFSDIFESVKSLFHFLYSNSYKISPSTIKPAANVNALTFAYPNSKIPSTPLFLLAPDDVPETATPLSAIKRRHTTKLSKQTTGLPRVNNFKNEINTAEIPNVFKTDNSLQKNSPIKSFSNKFSLPNCFPTSHTFSNQNISNSFLENPYNEHNYKSYSHFSNENYLETIPVQYAPAYNRQSTSMANTDSYVLNKYWGNTASSNINLSNFSDLQNVYSYGYAYENNNLNTAFKNLFSKNIAAHANGGILSKPHFGLVAEDGPEAIIPLSAKRRSRALSLWQETGEQLGIYPHAEGGIIGKLNGFTSQQLPTKSVPSFNSENSLSKNYYLNSQTPNEPPEPIFTNDNYSTQNNSDTASISVNIGSPSLQVTVNGTSQTDPESIVRIIREHLPELTDAIAAQLADAIQKVFANLPLVS